MSNRQFSRGSRITDDALREEQFDDPPTLERKITELAGLVKNSESFIAFTGAGVSTSAGVPDYRSTPDTVLKTGPGQWEDQDQKEKKSFEDFVNDPKSRKFNRVDAIKASPTLSHMALVELMNKGYLKYLVS